MNVTVESTVIVGGIAGLVLILFHLRGIGMVLYSVGRCFVRGWTIFWRMSLVSISYGFLIGLPLRERLRDGETLIGLPAISLVLAIVLPVVTIAWTVFRGTDEAARLAVEEKKKRQGEAQLAGLMGR